MKCLVLDNYGYSGNKNLKPEKSNTYEIYSNINLNEQINLSLRAFGQILKIILNILVINIKMITMILI